MQQFIPFEDEWDMLEKLLPESLIPYRVGVPCTHGLADTQAVNQCAPLTSPRTSVVHPVGPSAARGAWH